MSPSKYEFEAMVAEYECRIFNVVFRMVGDPDESADLVQETFVRAYRAFDRFRGDSQPYTWLYRIAVNVCRDYLVKRQRIRSSETSLEVEMAGGEAHAFEVPDVSASPERLMEQQELRVQIEKAIGALPPGYKECVLLREMEEMSYEQIAETLGITVEAVRSRLARARALMRQRLTPYLRA